MITCVLSLLTLPLASSRHVSTKVAEREEDAIEHDDDLPILAKTDYASGKIKSSKKSGDTVAVGSDFPEFSTLQDKRFLKFSL